MESALDTSADILAQNRVLYGGSGYGYNQGGYHVGNQVLAAQAHADGSAVKEAIDCNAIRVSDGLNSISNQFENGARQEQINSVNKNVTDLEFRTSDRFVSISKELADAEFRSLDRQRDIQAQLTDSAKEAAKCCCETQKLITAENNETRALILAVEGRATVAELAKAQSRINQLETINALESRRH